MPNPLHKITRQADTTTTGVLRALQRAQRSVRDAIADAAAAGHVAGSERERERIYSFIHAQYARLNASMAGDLDALVDAAAQQATDYTVSSTGVEVKYDKRRMEQVWDMISPRNTRQLAAVFTDQMSAQAVQALRSAFLDTYRQASVEGWSANATSRAMRDAWDNVARDGNVFRFRDRSGKDWENARYLQMLHRTTAMRVERDYTIDRMAEAGVSMYRISDGGTECDVCRAWQGQIIQMRRPKKGGRSLPTYAEAIDAGMFHPNCLHYLVPVDEDWGEDAAELGRQEKEPLPTEMNREAMQSRKDAIDRAKYMDQGMSQADAGRAVIRDRLGDAIRIGVFDRDVAMAVARGLDASVIDTFVRNGVPQFQMIKKGEAPGWHRGSAGGVIRTTRHPTPDEIIRIIEEKLKPKAEAKSETKLKPETATDRLMKEIGAKKTAAPLAENKTNPNFDKGPEYKINCQRCVPAWEMRKRGYDVEAKPKPENDDLGFKTLDKVFSDGVKLPYKKKKDIESAMSEWGDGARAQIICLWKGDESAHTFGAERVDGKTRYFDPQTGKEFSDAFKNISKSNNAKNHNEFMRIDTLTPGERIKECCKPSEG